MVNDDVIEEGQVHKVARHYCCSECGSLLQVLDPDGSWPVCGPLPWTCPRSGQDLVKVSRAQFETLLSGALGARLTASEG